MTAATLFSGIGAPEVAMPEWDWIWHAEIEKFPAAVMAERHPLSVNLGDVTADDFCERALAIGRPDVLVFGSPCQAFSVAGRRLGLDDPRGNLALVALGIVARLEPTWFVFENVPGLLSSSDGRDFGLFLRTVDDIRYHLAWRHLDAQFFGVAQRRRRLFAVSHARDWRGPAAVLLEPESLCWHPPTRGEAREDVTGTLASRTSAGGGLGTDFDLSGGVISIQGAGARSLGPNMAGCGVSAPGAPMYTLNATEHHAIAHSLRADGFDASEDGTGRGTPLVATFDPTQVTSKANRSGVQPERCHTLPSEGYAPVAYALRNDAARDGIALTPSADAEGRVRLRDPGFNVCEEFSPTLDAGSAPIAFSSKDYGADAGDIAPTLRSGGHAESHANGGVMPAVAFTNQWGDAAEVFSTVKADCNGALPMVHSTGVRRLTPRECERLQGFPDDYTLITYRGKPAADGPRYKAIGNSMAVPVVRWILSRLAFVHNLEAA